MRIRSVRSGRMQHENAGKGRIDRGYLNTEGVPAPRVRRNHDHLVKPAWTRCRA
jgi:hypothetical protein